MARSREADLDMKDEYDFSGGVRGKYARLFVYGARIRIRERDGSETIVYTPPVGCPAFPFADRKPRAADAHFVWPRKDEAA